MISETTLVGCENLPTEMAARLDEPWVFVGEVKGDRSHQCATCNKCKPTFATFAIAHPFAFEIVEMKGYLFITDDMIECMVYFGVCSKCNSVHWARQGPPFKRARCLVPSFQ